MGYDILREGVWKSKLYCGMSGGIYGVSMEYLWIKYGV